jgi:hypothetical protein
LQKLFENAAALLKFLEADGPEHYVFRGQTRAFEGPLLPSGLRGRFTPFDGSTGPSEWAGITTSRSLIEDEVRTRRTAFGEAAMLESVDDEKSIWDLPEAAYQEGFRDFYNQPHHHRMGELGNLLRESAIPAMSALLGGELGELLCQQYGFTSTALDVSTEPSVAMFFATHQAPFYSLVPDSQHVGVVYRWPRESAMIAQDVLLPLEGSDFDSITTSFRNFIKNSADLKVSGDALVRVPLKTGESLKRMMQIVAEGESRRGAMRFPRGTFDRSRIGCQRAALLWPLYQIVTPLRPRRTGDCAALIGDLLKTSWNGYSKQTYHSEVFHFRHGGAGLSDRLNKFDLWPSIKPTIDGVARAFRLELRRDHIIEFEDPYLEMMLRFFSSCSPCQIVIMPIGVTHGVVDLGYLLHPSDADMLAKRLKSPEIYTPIPTLRYIPETYVESFQTAFADAIEA